MLGTAVALHVLYGKGSALLQGTSYVPLDSLGVVDEEGEGGGSYVEGFRTFGASCGTVLRAGLGDVRLAGDWEGHVP